MHIIVEAICLEELEFKVHPGNTENLAYNLHVTCQSEYPTEDLLVQRLYFDVTSGVPAPPFELKFSFVSQFRSKGKGSPTLQEFAKANGPAYVVPYARELIANVTSRVGQIPPLVIPPINIFRLIEEGLHEPGDETAELSDEMLDLFANRGGEEELRDG